MDAVNWLLLNGGHAVQWLCGIVKALFGWVFAALDVVLNPVLSPLLALVNPLCTLLADGVYAAFSPLPVWTGITVLSALTGVLMLIAFRYLSNQRAIGRARDEITANLLALKLFKDEIRVALHAQWRLLRALARLQVLMLVPVLAMALPLMLGVAQMAARYQWRPLRPGEQTLIKLQLAPGHAELPEAVLRSDPGVTDVVGPVPGGGVLVWRARAGELGRHTLRFDVAGATVEKELVVSDRFERVSAERPGRRWTAQLLYATEPPLASDAPVQSIEIEYQGIESRVCGENWWVLYFLIVSMASALVLKPVFRVRF